MLVCYIPLTVAQTNFKLKFKRSSVYAGIEIGSKGVKISMLEIGKNAQNTGTFNVLSDSSVNTDFISFTNPERNVLKSDFEFVVRANETFIARSKRVR